LPIIFEPGASMSRNYVRIGDVVDCAACGGKGFVASAGAVPVAILCPGCGGSRTQIVERG
jgi:hypothetical protein